jgi:hypothetical protein
MQRKNNRDANQDLVSQYVSEFLIDQYEIRKVKQGNRDVIILQQRFDGVLRTRPISGA